jgi:hypothetical protein
VANRIEVGVAATTRTGPSHGPGIRTTNSSPETQRAGPTAGLEEHGHVGGRAAVGLTAERRDELTGARRATVREHPVPAVQHRADAVLDAQELVVLVLDGHRVREVPAVAVLIGAVDDHHPPHVAPRHQRDAERPPRDDPEPA